MGKVKLARGQQSLFDDRSFKSDVESDNARPKELTTAVAATTVIVENLPLEPRPPVQPNTPPTQQEIQHFLRGH